MRKWKCPYVSRNFAGRDAMMTCLRELQLNLLFPTNGAKLMKQEFASLACSLSVDGQPVKPVSQKALSG